MNQPNTLKNFLPGHQIIARTAYPDGDVVDYQGAEMPYINPRIMSRVLKPAAQNTPRPGGAGFEDYANAFVAYLTKNS